MSGKAESTTCQSSQGTPSNDRTHPTGAVEDKPVQGRGPGLRESQLDNTHAKDGDSNRTLATPELQDSAYSSAPSHESNNLDFDLSSDSDNDTDKPSAEQRAEGKSCHGNTSEQEVAGPEESKGLDEEENAPKEPSDVLLPDPDPGNASLDKRELETESQNSEQSGITTGEEMLDQSIEDEDDEDEADNDNDEDDHLIYLEEVLERVHAEYYARYQAYQRKEAPESPDIRKIVPELKSKTLEGATIVFSGLYPTNYPVEKTREYYHAKALGAKISRRLILSSKDPGRTTHLIAARAGE